MSFRHRRFHRARGRKTAPRAIRLSDSDSESSLSVEVGLPCFYPKTFIEFIPFLNNGQSGGSMHRDGKSVEKAGLLGIPWVT